MTHPDITLASFRVASAADALCLGVLGTQVFLDTYGTSGIRPALAEEALENFSTAAIAALLARPDTAFLLAEVSGRLVGFAQLTQGKGHLLASPGSPAELNRLYVQRPFLGRGIGKALLREAEHLAATRGAEVLWLTAWVGNERALAFYRSQGYREVGADLYLYRGNEYETRVFVRALTAGAVG